MDIMISPQADDLSKIPTSRQGSKTFNQKSMFLMIN